MRADSTTTDRYAVGPSETDFTAVEVDDKQKTAENYVLDATLDHTVTKRLYWQAGGGWLRNTFAGVDSRVAARAGMGYHFTEPGAKGAELKGALLATLTHQSEVVPDPSTDDTFVGLRGIVDFMVPFGPGGKSTLHQPPGPGREPPDHRRLPEHLVEQPERLHDRPVRHAGEPGRGLRQPARAQPRTPLRVGHGWGPRIGPVIGNVFVPLKKWDREFSVSLVLNLVPKKPTPPPPPPCAPCK